MHVKDIACLAMVGDRAWKKWMATFCRRFTSAKIRNFDPSKADQAGAWILDGLGE